MYNRYIVSVVHKVLLHIEYRAVSGVFRTIDPTPPLRPASGSSPPHQRRGGGVHTRRAVWGVGVNSSEDARHWIGILQYNPSTLEWYKSYENSRRRRVKTNLIEPSRQHRSFYRQYFICFNSTQLSFYCYFFLFPRIGGYGNFLNKYQTHTLGLGFQD